MPKVKVESNSNQSAKETFNKIKQMLENDQDIKRLAPGYTCTFNDSAMTGVAKGGQFQANMKVTDKGGANSHVEIEVDLPLMLTPFKGTVQSTLQKKLASALS